MLSKWTCVSVRFFFPPTHTSDKLSANSLNRLPSFITMTVSSHLGPSSIRFIKQCHDVMAGSISCTYLSWSLISQCHYNITICQDSSNNLTCHSILRHMLISRHSILTITNNGNITLIYDSVWHLQWHGYVSLAMMCSVQCWQGVFIFFLQTLFPKCFSFSGRGNSCTGTLNPLNQPANSVTLSSRVKPDRDRNNIEMLDVFQVVRTGEKQLNELLFCRVKE